MKSNRAAELLAITFTLGAVAVGLSGCFSMAKKDPAAVVAQAPAVAPDAPIVEAYMEYVGPPERWAGPQTLVVHLTARDPELASLTVTPPIGEPGALLAPSANSSMAGPRRPTLDGSSRIGYALARESLSTLAASVKGDDLAFSGCLYPLRLKLVRSNGAVVERNGCRSVEGWPIILGSTMSRVIMASVQTIGHGSPGIPERAVASH